MDDKELQNTAQPDASQPKTEDTTPKQKFNDPGIKKTFKVRRYNCEYSDPKKK
jgi:hypothetical protein